MNDCYFAIRAALSVMRSVNCLRIEADNGLTALAELEQTTGDLCPVCGWRTVLAWGCEKCERDELCKRMDALDTPAARADARIAELVDLLSDCRDCVASDINYTLSQPHHEPAAVDYLQALLARVDAAIVETGDAGV